MTANTIHLKQAARLSKQGGPPLLSFFGTSENAVKVQVWIAISVYVLVAIVKKRLNLDASLYTILQILSLTLFEKTPLNQVLPKSEAKYAAPPSGNQPNLFT